MQAKRKAGGPAEKRLPSKKIPRGQGPFPIEAVLETLHDAVRSMATPIVTKYSLAASDAQLPFRVLISTILSLRTKDATTEAASERLFALAGSPETMVKLEEETIAKTIFPVGFYRTKARSILDACQLLIDNHGGRVPREIDALLAFKGVGRKTANLVVTLGYGLPGICVDTHVHRITNRWGYVKTRTPEETEMVLRNKLPAQYWIPINDWLVAYGQNICVPISPWCSKCPLTFACRRVGIERSR